MKKIGILGGGQLARMLIQKGFQLGYEMHVLAQKKDFLEPAAQVTAYFHPGDPDQPKNVSDFLNAVDVITFESEFIPAAILKQHLTSKSACFFPSLDHMETFQDRLSQKETLHKYGISTLPYEQAKDQDQVLSAKDRWGELILKKRRGGYDGYGTYLIRSREDLLAAGLHKMGSSKVFSHQQIPGFIVEPRISFSRELSLIYARDQHGNLTRLPLVESYQKDSRCLLVKGPLALSKKQKSEVQKLDQQIKHLLTQIDYVGVIAFELFEIPQKEKKRLGLKSFFVVNEIAPRVHNTGHFSQDALDRDQFYLHIQCVAGARISPPQLKLPRFVMLNLLGTGKTRQAKPPAETSGILHWYGKEENREGRKLGHMNYLGREPLRRLEQRAKRDLKLWRKGC